MANLKAKIIKLEQSRRQDQGVIVVEMQRGETDEQALARMGIDRAKLHPSQLIVFLNRWVGDRDES